jgi:hypothetical protein
LQFDAPTRLLSIIPFARRFAAELEVSAQLPDRDRVSVLHLSYFNLLWVGSYVLERPLILPAGSTLTVRATYDNTEHCAANAGRTIGPIRFGDGPDEEMFKVAILTAK